LRWHVFPALEERLRTRRRHLEWVDLRLGVANASLVEGLRRELHVLKVCLSEVKRCRPFPSLCGRVRRHTAGWDSEPHSITGLEAGYAM